jgi:hypothetical protein
MGDANPHALDIAGHAAWLRQLQKPPRTGDITVPRGYFLEHKELNSSGKRLIAIAKAAFKIGEGAVPKGDRALRDYAGYLVAFYGNPLVYANDGAIITSEAAKKAVARFIEGNDNTVDTMFGLSKGIAIFRPAPQPKKKRGGSKKESVKGAMAGLEFSNIVQGPRRASASNEPEIKQKGKGNRKGQMDSHQETEDVEPEDADDADDEDTVIQVPRKKVSYFWSQRSFETIITNLV